MIDLVNCRARRAGRVAILCASLTAAIAFSPPLTAQNSPDGAIAIPINGLATGAANINITPRRVIFDRNKRTEAVYLFNQGNAAVTVDVALVDNVMLPNGELVPVSRAVERGPEVEAQAQRIQSAVPMLLATPSRLTLAPGQGKTIRIRATLPTNDTATEYRTHLTVTTVPPADTGLTAEQAAASARGELVLRIQSVFGLSIPLIVRAGETSATASIGPIALGTDAGQPVLEVPIGREGTASLYGNLEARVSKTEVVGFVRGLGVYAELSQRMAKIPLNRKLGKGEKVTVTYFAEGTKGETALATGGFSAP